MLSNESETPVVNPGNYSPFTLSIRDSVGAIFLGILSVIMLIGWRRAETRYHRLMKERLAEKSSSASDTVI